MEKTINLRFGPIRGGPQASSVVVYQAGWYVDLVTGMPIYYDPATDKFYTPMGSVFVPLGYMQPAPKQVSIGIGDTLKIKLGFKYTGPKITGAKAYYAIGVYGIGFTECVTKLNTFDIPANTTTTPIDVVDEANLIIPTTADVSWNDIYVKIYSGSPGIPDQIFGYIDALVIIGKDPTITGFEIKDFSKV